MVRRTRPPRPKATHAMTLNPLKESCQQCGQPLWVGCHGHRTVTKLDGLRVLLRELLPNDTRSYA
jgi:hypothetical protein